MYIYLVCAQCQFVCICMPHHTDDCINDRIAFSSANPLLTINYILAYEHIYIHTYIVNICIAFYMQW